MMIIHYYKNYKLISNFEKLQTVHQIYHDFSSHVTCCTMHVRILVSDAQMITSTTYQEPVY